MTCVAAVKPLCLSASGSPSELVLRVGEVATSDIPARVCVTVYRFPSFRGWPVILF